MRPFVWALLALSVLGASTASAQRLRRPLACDTCITGWYYFDQDAASTAVEDWSCGATSYDGHRGTDFSLRGGNGAIDTGYDVLAAADGEVVSTQDGHFDRCTMCGGTGCGLDFGFGYGNHVVINHGGYRVIYAHMRTGSVAVAPGDRVTCGQRLGQIGSSGCSTGAHLHFETRPVGGAPSTAFDPFAGMCSPTSPELWVSQGPHRGLPAAACEGVAVCPDGTYPIWTCTDDTHRRRCIDGVDMTEECLERCVRMPTGTDDVCEPVPDAGVDVPDASSLDGGTILDASGLDASGLDASALDAGVPTRDGRIDGGCGCRAAGGPRGAPALASVCLALALIARRRAR